MDSFHTYLKKQLLEYVEAERDKGVPLEKIEQVLVEAGHHRNIIDEVFEELKKEQAGKKTSHKDAVENDLVGMLKYSFREFMAKATKKEVESAKSDLKKTNTEGLIKDVVEDAEVIEEKKAFEILTFFIYIIGLALTILFTAGSTDSQITNVVIGFSPAIISIFLSFLAVPVADNVPLYVTIPLIVSSVFYGLGRFANLGIFQGLDIESLAIVNFLFAFVFNILIVYVRFLKPRSMRRRVIKKPVAVSVEKPEHPNTEETVEIETERHMEEKEGTQVIRTTHTEKRKEIQDLKKEFNL